MKENYWNKFSDETSLKISLDDDEFLTKFLRWKNHSAIKAFAAFQEFYRFKSEHPEIALTSLMEIREVLEDEIVQVLPIRDRLMRRVAVISMKNFDVSKISYEEIFRSTCGGGNF